ncbi:MAG: PEP-CTERM sorting domain-containing protein [Candidatus Omnitrophica bacterium]|nr:PEP-CTERM sorting domain-containing protein [Candidatus Omnitrophota bacterium]
MKFLGSLFLMVVVLALLTGPGHALSINQADYDAVKGSLTYTADLLTDHSGGSGYSVYGISCGVVGDYLWVSVHTNFPKSGLTGSDSYASGNLFNPGDLYINVGGTFQSASGSAYGVATTSHGNNVTQAYNTWGNPVVEGGLYSPAGGGPFFADGTYEVYEATLGVVSPSDGDGSIVKNSYPTMIRYGQAVVGDNSGTAYLANVGNPWNYDIVYKVSTAAIGYTGAQDLQLFWAMECGNDGVECVKTGEVPEPATMALVAAGVTAMAVRRKSIV